MPRRRPMDLLRRLGRRIRARRLKLARTKVRIAKHAEISVQQLDVYERGFGHPPAVTLHRIAMALSTTTSHLLGEDTDAFHVEQFDEIAKLYTDPAIGQVTRYMQDMDKADQQSLKVIAAAFAERKKAPVERAEVMR